MEKNFMKGLLVLALVTTLGAIGGALSMGITAIAIGGGAYLLGFVPLALARAIALWVVMGGALLGAAGASIQVLIFGAMQ